MIDDLALGLTMVLMAMACMRLLSRPDLDIEPEPDAAGNDNTPGARRHAMKLPGEEASRA